MIGEIACGHRRNRREPLQLLQNLSTASEACITGLVMMIKRHQLIGRGISWVEVHLLASAKLSTCALETLDRPLVVVAREQGVTGG